MCACVRDVDYTLYLERVGVIFDFLLTVLFGLAGGTRGESPAETLDLLFFFCCSHAAGSSAFLLFAVTFLRAFAGFLRGAIEETFNHDVLEYLIPFGQITELN